MILGLFQLSIFQDSYECLKHIYAMKSLIAKYNLFKVPEEISLSLIGS